MLSRYLAGESSDAEQIQIEELFASGTLSPDLYKNLRSDWEGFQAEMTPEVDHLLDRIHHLLRKKEIQRRNTISNRFIFYFSRIAAVLIGPLLLISLWMYLKHDGSTLAYVSATATIYAPPGSRVSFELPDGSTGFLNGGSSLMYSNPFSHDRCVTIIGEAWVDVAHDAIHPFEVRAAKTIITVLGTSFNVSAYDNDKFVEIVLAEGSVSFKPDYSKRPVILQPSDRMVYDGSRIHIEQTDPLKYKAWTQGKLIFRGDNMLEVGRRLERWYNIDVEVVDRELIDYTFRATFEDDSLYEVLTLLARTSPIRYVIIPRKEMPNGSWQKEKVLFYKK